ncbi:DUF2971 domain-containing protein [Ruegeria sp.]|uniref:DUF2971 domain-containing protein n=1 Tax=Ruegeria sp. TaxID=1879320 RepID=UPI003C7A7B28
MDQAEISDETLIYKYVPAKRAMSCLPEIGDGALRATQPSAMNDPFECSFSKVFKEKDKQEGNMRFAEVLTQIQPDSPIVADDIEAARQKYGSLYIGELYRQQLSTRFGIISFSTDPFHPLLWAHYTLDGSGFAIGYKAAEIKRRFEEKAQLKRVCYISNPGVISDYIPLSWPESNLINAMQHKSNIWEYESECRLIIELHQTLGTGETDHHGQPVNLLRIPNEAVGSIYYTERTPTDSVKEIDRRLKVQNNRYGVRNATKLVLADNEYRYKEAGQDEI